MRLIGTDRERLEQITNKLGRLFINKCKFILGINSPLEIQSLKNLFGFSLNLNHLEVKSNQIFSCLIAFTWPVNANWIHLSKFWNILVKIAVSCQFNNNNSRKIGLVPKPLWKIILDLGMIPDWDFLRLPYHDFLSSG